MPVWSISEPYISLQLQDEPLGYQPALGPRVSFHLFYREIGSLVEDPTVFSVGTNWSCSFRSFVFAPTNADVNTVFLHKGVAGWVDYLPGLPQARDGSFLSTLTGGGFQIVHVDGSVDTYSVPFTCGDGGLVYFISTKTDPAGNSLTFNYTVTGSGILQLTSVTDADGNSTHLYYENTTFSNLITRVVDPFSRTNLLAYDNTGYLTNIVDVAGFSSSFKYDSGTITNLATPYGNTGFWLGDYDYYGDNRFAQVTLPTGGRHLYVYHDYCSFLVGWNPTVPDTSPFTNDFEHPADGWLNFQNSFYWSPLQYEGLSTTDPTALTSSDYAKGRLRHWLIDGNDDDYGSTDSPALGLERAPSPDGTTEGQITWYDYAGKPDEGDLPNAGYEGSSDFPSMVAQVLPGGSTRFAYYQRGPHLNITNEVSTYTAIYGTTALRTNIYYYADNAIDLRQWVGAYGEQVVSNYFASGNNIHRPDASYDALNQGTLFTYNGYGQLTSAKTPAGLTTTNTYYASGASINRLYATMDIEIGRSNTYTYYANGLVDTRTDERGLVTTEFWDNLQRLTGVAYPDGSTISNKYTFLDLTATKDRLGNWTLDGYNAIRQKITETNANGVVTGFGYCDCGLLFATTNAWNTSAQMITTYGYDNQGNRLYTFLPDETITNWYDSLGRVTATADSWGDRWLYYNNQGLLFAVTNDFGLENYTVFDAEDRPVSATDADQVTVTSSYDLLGRVTAREYPDGGLEQFGYSPRGLVVYTNQLNQTNFYVYDAASRKIFETNANGEVIAYAYNPAGDLLTLTDGKNQTTTWIYDQYGRVTNKLDQASALVFSYQYDADNRLTNRWSAANSVNTVYSYDYVGNLINVWYPDDTPVQLQYDSLNRLTRMVDASGTNLYTYASGGELLTDDGPFASDTITNLYTHRLRAELILQQPAGLWTNGFAYDAAKRLTDLVSPAGNFAYNYDSVRQRLLISLGLPNTSYITNAYDGNARLLYTKLRKSDGTILDSALYGYNAGNQRTTFTNAAAVKVSYAYDNIGQLKIAASSASSENRGYAYDAAWNLNYLTNNGSTTNFSVDGKNELTAVGGTSCSYDAGGNLTNNGSMTYLYDDENRLSGSVDYGTGFGASFVYDGLGRLREQLQWEQGQDTSSATRPGFGLDSGIPIGPSPPECPFDGDGWGLVGGILYVYDGNRVIQERAYFGGDPTVSYTRGNDLSGTLEGAGGIGGLLARSSGYDSGNWGTHCCYHADGNGNITYLETSAQGLGASYRYDAFGNVLNRLDLSGDFAIANTYRFSSKEWVPMANAYYYLYRFYDPSIQRWLNRDPINQIAKRSFVHKGRLLRLREDANLYQFVHNNPLKFVDSLGLFGAEPLPGKVNGPPDMTISCPLGGGSVTTSNNDSPKEVATIIFVGTTVIAAGTIIIIGPEGAPTLDDIFVGVPIGIAIGTTIGQAIFPPEESEPEEPEPIGENPNPQQGPFTPKLPVPSPENWELGY